MQCELAAKLEREIKDRIARQETSDGYFEAPLNVCADISQIVYEGLAECPQLKAAKEEASYFENQCHKWQMELEDAIAVQTKLNEEVLFQDKHKGVLTAQDKLDRLLAIINGGYHGVI